MKKFNEYVDFDLAKINSEVLDFGKMKMCLKNLLKKGPPLNLLSSMKAPSANGMPGIHHVMGRTIKDLFCRYKTLRVFGLKEKLVGMRMGCLLN